MIRQMVPVRLDIFNNSLGNPDQQFSYDMLSPCNVHEGKQGMTGMEYFLRNGGFS